ncbi:MAG: DUF1818 family protein [Synechococcus sp.]
MLHPELNHSSLQVGKGWRVGFKSGHPEFCALVGADTWAIELTLEEWQDFCSALRQIEAAIANLPDHLMEEEAVTLEQSSERIVAIASGELPRLSLYLQVKGHRGAEGYWDCEALPQLFDAVGKFVNI